MNFDEIEELIRKYLSAGITAIVIIISPGTAPAPGAAPTGPDVRIIEPQTPSPARADDQATDGANDPVPADPDRTGAGGNDPGQDPVPEDEEGTDGTGRAGSAPEDDEASTGNGAGTGSRSGTGGAGGSADRESGGDSDGGSENGSGGSTGRDAGSGSGSESDRDSDVGGSRARNDSTGSTDESDTGMDSGRSRSDSGDQDSGPGSAAEDTGGNSTRSGPAADAGGTTTTRGDGVTAAEVHGWGAPNREDDFSNGLEQWNVYDGPGHAGQGTRSPSAATVANGMLTITGDSSGTTAGMAWNPGQKYGRWEGRVKAPASDPSYNALLLLWPDAENFPVGGEIDFMEMMDHTRQVTDIFIHYGEDNSQVNGKVEIDATEWHNWAVEWTPEAITAYVDGEEWYRTTDTSIFPPGPMHLCVQLDWFPEGDSPQESYMYVDWVRQYSLDGPGGSDSGTGRGTGRSGDSAGSGDEDSGADSTADNTGDGGDGSRNSRSGDSGNDNGAGSGEEDTATRIREAIRRLFFWR